MFWKRLTSWLRSAPAGIGGRSTLASVAASFGIGPDNCSSEAQHRTAFTIAFVALAAKMAKADGVAVIAETNAFERWFHVPEDQREAVRRVFDLAKRDVAGYESYAEQIAGLLVNEPDLKRDVFECLFHVASADGVLHEAEERFLVRVARILGIPDEIYVDVRHMFVVDDDDPYTVLGVPRDISDADLKTRYRRLAMDNHSDRLAAHGVPREFQIVADRKLAAINDAYDRIVKSRQRQSAGNDT
ncbi:MAG: TerB family tellurite resistance protein [Hyphomicrobiaceae bacterium]